MAKQIQPRPHLTNETFRTFTTRSVTGVLPNVQYHYQNRRIKVGFEETQFPRYSLSREGRRSLNPLNAYVKTFWRKYPVVQSPPNNMYLTSLYDCGLPNPDSSWLNPSRVQDGAITKLLGEVADAKVDLLTFWAERQKTADMLRNRLMQAYYALRAIKRLDLAKAVRIIKNGKSPASLRAADLRLELVYGWAPFISDIYGLCTMKPPIPSQRVKASFSQPSYKRREFGDPNRPESPNGEDLFTIRIRAKCIMDLEMDIPVLTAASQLGLTNPVNTAWELVPFSFVVDWFLPIQSYISQFSALDGFVIKDKLLVTKTTYSATRFSRRHGSSTKDFKSMTRTKNFSLNPPPYLKNPVSTDHVLNALALIRSVKGGTRGWKYG